MVCAALSGLQSRKAAKRDAGTSGEWLDALCRPESAALRVAPRRPPASRVPRARSARCGPQPYSLIRFSARSWRIERLGATRAVTVVRSAG